eukprot:scaffold168695_cov17-Tisochrysis_lutea.AAC.1
MGIELVCEFDGPLGVKPKLTEYISGGKDAMPLAQRSQHVSTSAASKLLLLPTLESTTICFAISKSAAASTYTWQMPSACPSTGIFVLRCKHHSSPKAGNSR